MKDSFHCLRMFSFILVFLIYFFNFDYTYAIELNFEEPFLDLNYWNISSNSGSVFTKDGGLYLKGANTSSYSFPYLFPKENLFNDYEDFEFSVEFLYIDRPQTFGNGIAIISQEITPPNGTSSVIEYNTIFNVWYDGAGLILYSWFCDDNSRLCRTFKPLTKPSSNPLEKHTFKFQYVSGIYTVYFDSDIVFVSNNTQVKPKNIWIGQPIHTYTDELWQSFSINYISVTPINKGKVIFIPGLGASWDFANMLGYTTSDNWTIPDFVDVYKPIIDNLEKAGYEKGKNFYIYTYDWRKDLVTQADDFNEYLNSVGISQADNITVIGHSLGGLVVKSYARKYGDGLIDKLLTVGSPHDGAIDAYLVWEGGYLPAGKWWEKAAFEIITQNEKNPFENRLTTLRNQAPIFKDLLPIFPFIRRDGLMISLDKMIERNSTLQELRNKPADQSSYLSLTGSGVQTKSAINVTGRNILDKLRGLWADGKPASINPFEFSWQGDGTVLSSSASLGKSQSIEEDHLALIYKKDSISKIFSTVGVNGDISASDSINNSESATVVMLQSPGQLNVCDTDGKCDNSIGWLVANDKLFLSDRTFSELKIKVVGGDTETGEYLLSFADIQEEINWYKFNGNLIGNDEDIYFWTGGSKKRFAPDDTTWKENFDFLIESLDKYEKSWGEKFNIREYLKNLKIDAKCAKYRVAKNHVGWLSSKYIKNQEIMTLIINLHNLINARLAVCK